MALPFPGYDGLADIDLAAEPMDGASFLLTSRIRALKAGNVLPQVPDAFTVVRPVDSGGDDGWSDGDDGWRQGDDGELAADGQRVAAEIWSPAARVGKWFDPEWVVATLRAFAVLRASWRRDVAASAENSPLTCADLDWRALPRTADLCRLSPAEVTQAVWSVTKQVASEGEALVWAWALLVAIHPPPLGPT
ncbi:uncharacterized protein AMSG_09708 [Thecamonas trahens ATCC 50062]|uniref:Uncharacterized protein n=1 Tax=Thecamonas trahens ATCC 50062 TaxID=461836 RepID=A0A0L0DPU6_THETB|nr:hypothetical protein AMSG_09708 [Thecamonas trahens ATCC 50062]KNC54046.1 hypothetical protein AMSG_09708 [Thecamonas trahens ATCC 50062]|eukprot:XP_013754057.1 hypothetical protein AMSG_09708 [Thecamonas trahens ATCC 50062]